MASVDQNLRMASELYRIARRRKPATRMLMQLVLILTVFGVWAGLTPYTETVVNSVAIVARDGIGNAVDGTMSPGCPLSGTVKEVAVTELQAVKKGDVLIQLDPSEYVILKQGELEKIESLTKEIDAKGIQEALSETTYRNQRAELVVQLNAQKQLDVTRNNEQKIKIERLKAELQRVTRELARGKKLVTQRAISKSEFESIDAEYAEVSQNLSLAKLPLEKSLVAEIGMRIETLDSEYQEEVHRIHTETLALQNKIAMSRNQIAVLDLRIEQCAVISPVSGVVSSCVVQPGDWVSPGTVGVTVSRAGMMAEALLPSSQIGDVRPGANALIMLDGIEWLTHGSLKARVMSISTDLCQKEVALGDGSRQIIDGYRVWLELSPDDRFSKWDSVRLGMTGVVEIETEKNSLAIYLVEKAIGTTWMARLGCRLKDAAGNSQDSSDVEF